MIGLGVKAQPTALSGFFAAVSDSCHRRGMRVILVNRPRRTAPDLTGWVVDATREIRPGLRGVLGATRLCRQVRPVAVVGNFSYGNQLLVAAASARVPVRVSWVHTPLDAILGGHVTWRDHARLLRNRAVLRLATLVIANSDAVRNEVHDNSGVSPRRTMTVHNSIPDPLAGAEPSSGRRWPTSPMILAVARNHPTKGLDVLLTAMSLMTEPIKATFVGPGTDDGSLEAMADDLGIRDRCTFVGEVPYTDVLDRMRTAAVHVLPSHFEAFGLVNIEAMAVGTPVVATNTGGIPEVVDDGVTGVLVEPGNPIALAREVELLVGDAERWTAMSRAARERYLSRFESTRVAEQFVATLSTLVAESRN